VTAPSDTAATSAPRRRWRRWVLAATLAVSVWAVVSAALVVSAARDLDRGQRAIDAARAKARPSELAMGRPVRDLLEGKRRFQRAAGRTGHPLLAPARALPVIGRQLWSVTHLARSAATVAATSADAISDAEAALEDSVLRPEERVAKVRFLADLAARARTQLGALSLGPRVGLFPALARARNEFAGELGELRDGLNRVTRGAGTLADVLTGPRRFLLFAANNAEMRAGSGMFLSVGELETMDGVLELGPMVSVTQADVPEGAVRLEGDLADRWGWLSPQQEWRNLMLSPRFDANAALAARMWEAAGNSRVDGVIGVDPVALAVLLSATGPVDVEGRQFHAGNVVDELLHGQYARFSPDDITARRDELGQVAKAVFDLLDRGGWSLPALADGIAEAARGRHLLVWSAADKEQDGWQAAGVDGALQPDSLLLSLLNRGVPRPHHPRRPRSPAWEPSPSPRGRRRSGGALTDRPARWWSTGSRARRRS
jgi:hypothetical protein